MNKKVGFFSVVYSSGQLTLGLLLHPYQTMQFLVEDKVFVWLALLPTGLLAVITVLWRFLIVPVVSQVFSCSVSGFFLCNYLTFVSNWITFFCIYWQVLLMYLLVRFSKLYRSRDVEI